MKLEQSFEVAAPIDAVWSALIDVERVAPCLPGAAVEGRDDDGAYRGSFQVKLGPTTASYRGTIRLTEVDEQARVATMEAKGTDRRGQGGATATIVNRLAETDGGTRVDTESDVAITGRLARFGRPGMIQDISARMLREFAARLQEQLQAEGGAADDDDAPPEPEPPAHPVPAPSAEPVPVGGVGLVLGAAGDRLRSSPAAIAALFAAIGALIVLLAQRVRR